MTAGWLIALDGKPATTITPTAAPAETTANAT
jgi:hypothetical protein